ncbi:hypothetical protein E2C01_090025 [Portunus trituberculatus]|uniref:Uncharacterized protein n=1 Tax=Portunus trituberculatus TaxID=210409 RepID=A0A5B7JP01_PORTR|nr:hypothetical protein [Portunus trituberculatus]
MLTGRDRGAAEVTRAGGGGAADPEGMHDPGIAVSGMKASCQARQKASKDSVTSPHNLTLEPPVTAR